ncbi:MAG: D-2-hydroxyacid dehydrogenase [Clostridia bacterium]|nr:D-2-hydroxyacid dehydrogenase [Clostridia bacterium]
MNILVTLPVEARHKALLESACEGCFTYCPAKDLTQSQVHGADIIIGNVKPDMIRGTEKLKWLQLNSAGTDGYTAPGVLPAGCLLTNATGAYGLAISEHMMAMLLFLMKKINLYSADQKDHSWSDHGQVRSVYGSRTLVVGFGDIGSCFARRMHDMGSTVTGIRRSKTEKPDYLEGLYQMDSLKEELGKADIVAACLPGTPETKGLFDEAAFAAMKPGAWFINVGRGNAVNQDALLAALQSGHLAGAAVDVTDPEPLPKDHPLWDAPNLLITPHISGQFHLQETFERIIRIAAENLTRFVSGELLKNQVDFATGYRRLDETVSPDR